MGLVAKKGNAPATGKVKSDRAAMLLAEQAQLAQEQHPESFTMDAIRGNVAAEQPKASEPVKVAEPVVAPAEAKPATSATSETQELLTLPLDDIHRSPFQPKGRPSTAAVDSVRQALLTLGDLSRLMGAEGTSAFIGLSVEAKRLAELAFDIQQRGLTDPIEVRSTPENTIECLRGHRRMAGARLAGLTHVPVFHRGAMTNAQAAASVLSGNLHRENFTVWQEAVLATQLQEQRRANDHPHDVRSLGAVLGWSHGKVQNLLSIRRNLNHDFLIQAGNGNAELVEELLSRTSAADLGRLVILEDSARTDELHRRLGWAAGIEAPRRTKASWILREKRGGGLEVVINRSIESLSREDAAALLDSLEGTSMRVRARITALEKKQ